MLHLKVNQSLIKFSIVMILLIFELGLWLPYLLTLPENVNSSFGIIVYIASPIILVLGIVICIFACKRSGEIICENDKIIINNVTENENITLDINKNMSIEFSRCWQFSTFMVGPGQIIIVNNETAKPISIYLDKNSYNKMREFYENKNINFS